MVICSAMGAIMCVPLLEIGTRNLPAETVEEPTTTTTEPGVVSTNSTNGTIQEL